MNLKPETLQKIDEVITHYPVKRSAALPLLHLVQEEQGYISAEAIEWIAAKLELAADQYLRAGDVLPDVPAEADRPPAHQGLPHAVLRAGRRPAGGARSSSGNSPATRGRTSADGQVTVEFVECLASCGSGPVVMIDEELHERVDVARARELCEQIKAEAAADAGK